MESLIVNLKKEHDQIISVLNEVNTLGIYSERGQILLIDSKTALLAHLHREDTEFYPVLRKEAQKNDSLSRTLDVFAKEMESISKAALDFFEKYKSGGSGIEFARDFGRLFSILQMRIGREERILYPEFLKLQNS